VDGDQTTAATGMDEQGFGGPQDDDGYAGPATLYIEDEELPCNVVLRGFFHPVGGHYRWHGRIAADDAVNSVMAGKVRTAVIETPEGRAVGRVADADPWGRYRISGVSTPPFAVHNRLPEL
jgi:hypothetical protein